MGGGRKGGQYDVGEVETWLIVWRSARFMNVVPVGIRVDLA